MKKILNIFIILSFPVTLIGQSLDEFFLSLPESYLSQISSNQRLELVDKVRNGIDSTIINNYGGSTKLEVYDELNYYLRLKTSGQGFFEIKKWDLPDASPLYAVSFWVCSPACDGVISFLNEDYTPAVMGISQFPDIKIKDFLDMRHIAEEGKSPDEIENKFDIFFIRFELSPDGKNIVVVNDNEKYMNKEDYEKIKPYLLGDRMSLAWKGGYFEIENVYFSSIE